MISDPSPPPLLVSEETSRIGDKLQSQQKCDAAVLICRCLPLLELPVAEAPIASLWFLFGIASCGSYDKDDEVLMLCSNVYLPSSHLFYICSV